MSSASKSDMIQAIPDFPGLDSEAVTIAVMTRFTSRNGVRMRTTAINTPAHRLADATFDVARARSAPSILRIPDTAKERA
jgi:hypothetical protein